MSELQGYCAHCPCWFAIPDPELNAHRLCPCCLRPATNVRYESAANQRLHRRVLRRLRHRRTISG